MKTLTNEEKKFIRQIVCNDPTTPAQWLTQPKGNWKLFNELYNAVYSATKSKRQQEIMDYIDSLGGLDNDD